MRNIWPRGLDEPHGEPGREEDKPFLGNDVWTEAAEEEPPLRSIRSPELSGDELGTTPSEPRSLRGHRGRGRSGRLAGIAGTTGSMADRQSRGSAHRMARDRIAPETHRKLKSDSPHATCHPLPPMASSPLPHCGTPTGTQARVHQASRPVGTQRRRPPGLGPFGPANEPRDVGSRQDLCKDAGIVSRPSSPHAICHRMRRALGQGRVSRRARIPRC